MSMSKGEIKKNITLGEKVYAKFLAHAMEQGTTEQVAKILDKETERAMLFAEAFGVVDILVNGTKVVVWTGITKEQMKHQVNVAFVKMANKNRVLN